MWGNLALQVRRGRWTRQALAAAPEAGPDSLPDDEDVDVVRATTKVAL
jgi:hypothetical protein